jgi:hypothetical protein
MVNLAARSQRMNTTIEDDDIRPPPHYHEGGPPQIVTADTARQGPLGRRVLIVLLLSLLGTGAAWLAIAMIYGHG